MDSVAYTLAKIFELAGMALMPLALYVGFTVEGSPGMVLQLKYLLAGILLFGVGRGLEARAGRAA